MSGAVVLTTRSGENRFYSGEHFIVPPHEPHSLTVESQTGFAALCLEHSKLNTLNARTLDQLIRTRPLSGTLSDQHLSRLITLGKKMRLQMKAITRAAHEKSMAQTLTQTLVDYPEETRSVKEMANLAKLSPWHFVRRFQHETGMTPHAMQIACCISKARQLLLNRTPIAEAALVAGFTDQSHMHKVFKQHHGLTPREFIKAASALES